MAYYILPKGFALRGWKGVPFALRYPDAHSTDFFDKEGYHVVYALDGRHDINRDELTEKQRKLLDHLIDIKIALPSDGAQRLEPWQEYKRFPGIYKNSVQWSITGRCNYQCTSTHAKSAVRSSIWRKPSLTLRGTSPGTAALL